MASASEIIFPYNESLYTAEVKRVDSSIYIFVPDQSLHHILPEGKAAFKLQQEVKPNDQQLTSEQDLILSILGDREG